MSSSRNVDPSSCFLDSRFHGNDKTGYHPEVLEGSLYFFTRKGIPPLNSFQLVISVRRRNHERYSSALGKWWIPVITVKTGIYHFLPPCRPWKGDSNPFYFPSHYPFLFVLLSYFPSILTFHPRVSEDLPIFPSFPPWKRGSKPHLISPHFLFFYCFLFPTHSLILPIRYSAKRTRRARRQSCIIRSFLLSWDFPLLSSRNTISLRFPSESPSNIR